MKLIPAIDIIDEQCVRLSQGDYNEKKVYNSNPVDVAKEFEDCGIKYLHLVDLDGAKAGSIQNIEVLRSIANSTNLRIDFGGGVKSDDDISKAFEAGASQVTCGSIAVKNPDLVQKWKVKYGAEKLILGADVKDEMIAINGWTQTSDSTIHDLLDQYLSTGIQHVICTDIANDGMLQGPSIALYKELLTNFPSMKLIASGGVSSISDLYELQKIGCYGAIIGKAIYEQKISLGQLRDFNDA